MVHQMTIKTEPSPPEGEEKVVLDARLLISGMTGKRHNVED